jgi:hypothetical protein
MKKKKKKKKQKKKKSGNGGQQGVRTRPRGAVERGPLDVDAGVAQLGQLALEERPVVGQLLEAQHVRQRRR